MSTTRLSEVADMFDQGMSITAIAEELGMSEGTVRSDLHKLGKDTRRPSKNPNEEQIVLQYQTAKPVSDILREYNLSYAQLYAILDRRDIPLRKHTAKITSAERLAQAIELYKSGQELWFIKNETGIAQPTLHAEIHRLGIPLRKPRRKPEIEAEQEVPNENE